jgi:MFS family permease
MVCSKAWISSLLQSFSYIGSLFGYIIMSHIGDNYGRKKGEYISWLICIAGQLVMLFSVNLPMVGMGSFLLGFGANAAITLHYSFFKELVLGETRSRMVIAIQLAFSVGITLISLLSYLIYEWKYTLAFFILIPSIIATFTFKLVE